MQGKNLLKWENILQGLLSVVSSALKTSEEGPAIDSMYSNQKIAGKKWCCKDCHPEKIGWGPFSAPLLSQKLGA